MKNTVTFEEFVKLKKSLLHLKEGEQEYHTIESENSRVLVSAPHGVGQVRLGKKKFAEPSTIGIALALNNKTGCNTIIKVANEHNDANFDMVSKFKTKMEDMIIDHRIRFVLDIHSLASWREELVNVGIYHGYLLQTQRKESMLDVLIKFFEEQGLPVHFDQPFSAGPKTITYYFGEGRKVFACQIEVNSKIFTKENETLMNGFIDAISNFIEWAENNVFLFFKD